MKIKEMIEKLRYKAENIKAKIEPEFFNEVADILEKQVSKKVCDFNEVQEDSFYHLSFMCPDCNEAVISQPYRPNFCKHCGQKLDWSEADD